MARQIEIAGREIGPGHPTYVIAEGCDNHLGDMDTAREMVRVAKAAGADAIKFQHHLPHEEMLRDVPMSSNFDIPLFEFLERYALKLSQHEDLMRYCKELGIQYLCTPFSRKAAEELNELGVDAFKIGSGELTDLPTLKVIAGFGKPMILSSGMSEWEEIDETIRTVQAINPRIAMMNCTSEYPCNHADVNLGVIRGMLDRYPSVVIGHSDHTPDIYTCFGAVAFGASLVEKHLILDRRQPGPDQSVSIEPFELAELVKGVRRVEVALGERKQVWNNEKPIRSWAHRSVVSIADIAEGAVITEGMVWTKRPGTGIPAKQLEEIIGRTAKAPIPADRLIRWEDLA